MCSHFGEDELSDREVLIVGAGLAGLCCARRLHAGGIPCRVFEASDDVGGRARTDEVDGFLLDRGFQVLLTAYPEATASPQFLRTAIGKIRARCIDPTSGAFHRFADPWRRPRHLLSTALSPVASLADKVRVARLRRRVCKGSLDQLYERPETTTIDALHKAGFSDRIVDCFFRPFLGGVFLDRELSTSSRMLDFVFRMFALGDAAIPAQGMRAIARQIAAQLPDATVQTNSAVEMIADNSVSLHNGESFKGRAVVVACQEPSAAELLGEEKPIAGQGVTCMYFAADRPPIEEAILVLNGDGEGPVNNLCVPSQLSPTYAPAKQSLISATVVDVVTDNEELQARVREQLCEWFGADAVEWRHLRTYPIPYALPNQAPPALSPVAKPSKRSDGVIVCGDYLDTASIQGAMISGRRAAEAILA